jgi:cation diffusion facilitator CzcD-associated flavoprotein CzcO
LRAVGAPIDHVFSRAFHLHCLCSWEHAVVIGGGITAAQTALTLAARAPGRVSMVTRHSPRIEMFDSDRAGSARCACRSSSGRATARGAG